MTDVVDAATRSRMMSGIRGKDTRPEIVVRKMLFRMGFRFRLHRKELPGSPDIVLPGRRIAIFVHGCFWHHHEGCPYARLPATRPDFWREKLEGNAARDGRAQDTLRQAGWRVLVIWECAVRDRATLATLPEMTRGWILGDAIGGQLSRSGLQGQVR